MANSGHPHQGIVARCLDELGLVSLYHTPRDVKILCLQRFVRLSAYGASTLVLVAYFQSLHFTKTKIGLFMTVTLAGDVVISFILALFADAMGRRVVLGSGAALMAGSGFVFATCGNYWILLAAAVFGVISPAGNEIGPFRAVEESVVAHLTSSSSRTDVYAWYSLSGTAGTALGIVTCGWVVHYLLEGLHWSLVEAYRTVFLGYALLGAIKFVLVFVLSREVEIERKSAEARHGDINERAPLLRDDDRNGAGNGPEEVVIAGRQKRGLSSLLPEISEESIRIMISLCMLFALDAFASGLAPLSWVTFFFRSHYDLEEGKLGSVFFVTSIIAAISMIVASSLAKRFGNVNTMVFTHLPSAIFLALIPIPNEVHWSLLFLILRSVTQSMDVAPRSAFMAAIILPQERTAIMGLVNVVKTTAQSLGPLITGILADKKLFWVAFVCSGSLKASYDLGMLALFKNHERAKAERERVEAERRLNDEEIAREY